MPASKKKPIYARSLLEVSFQKPTAIGLENARSGEFGDRSVRTAADFRRVFRTMIREANLRVANDLKTEMARLLNDPKIKASGESADNFIVEDGVGPEETTSILMGHKTKGNFFILFGWGGAVNRQLPDRNNIRKWLQAKGVTIRIETETDLPKKTTRYTTVKESRRARAHIRVLNKSVEDVVLWRIRRSIKTRGSYNRFSKMSGSNATGSRYDYVKIAMRKVIGKGGEKLFSRYGKWLSEVVLPMVNKAFTMEDVASRRYRYK